MWLLFLTLTYIAVLGSNAEVLSVEEDDELNLNLDLNQNDTSIGLKFATECTTPNGDKGFCLEVSKCPHFAKLKMSPLHPAYDFYVASNCTAKNAKVMKMCCGSKMNFDSQIPKKQEAVDIADLSNPLPQKCGQQKLLTFNSRVMSGTEAAIGEFPWMGRLIHRDRGGHQEYGCSAFLIHERFAITAAHCINSKLLRIIGPVFSIVLGDHNSTSEIDCVRKKCAPPPQKIPVGKVIGYSGYNTESGNHNNDIALIQLKKSAEFTNFVGPICLLDKKGQVDTFTISGWGRTETVEASEVKLKVDINRFPMKQCVEVYKSKGVMLNQKNQLCAGGEKNKDSCTGDSGGPLMAMANMTTWYAEGIVSFGFGCGQEGIPGVYTNIPTYLPWIKNTITKRLVKSKKPKKNSIKSSNRNPI